MIVDHGTVSASEAVALNARHSSRVTIFGERSEGATFYTSVNVVRILHAERRWVWNPWKDEKKQVDLAYYEGKYPKSLFNKGVRAENEDDLGFVAKETNDKIVVFGYSNDRYDIPKSDIIAVGMNVIIGKNFPELAKYKVDRNAPLPTGEPIETIAEEAFPEDHQK